MNTSSSVLNRLAAPAATAAGAVLGCMGIIELTHHQSSESTTVGIEHVSLGGFCVSLLLLVPVILFLGRLAGRPRFAAASATGQVALALWRSGRVPRWIAIGLPVSWFCMLPLAAVGGALGAGTFWLAVGWLLAHDALERRERRAPAGAEA
jgi:hypothetical protein